MAQHTRDFDYLIASRFAAASGTSAAIPDALWSIAPRFRLLE